MALTTASNSKARSFCLCANSVSLSEHVFFKSARNFSSAESVSKKRTTRSILPQHTESTNIERTLQQRFLSGLQVGTGLHDRQVTFRQLSVVLSALLLGRVDLGLLRSLHHLEFIQLCLLSLLGLRKIMLESVEHLRDDTVDLRRSNTHCTTQEKTCTAKYGT